MLGKAEYKMNKPKYSICMCNYNMEKTLSLALESVLSQVDEAFEVVLVDDGSSDRSLFVASRLREKYQNLRIIPLRRDKKRKLGQTRNLSIEHAKGEYVLLHLDCDDLTAPFIKDFVVVYHHLEPSFPDGLLLSGLPIQMGKRDHLLKHGPYRNINRGEDRDMWARFSRSRSCIPLKHMVMKERLPKPASENFQRAVYYTFDIIRNDFRLGTKFLQFLRYEFRPEKQYSLKLRVYRLGVSPFAWIKAKWDGKIFAADDQVSEPEDRIKYREEMGGSYPDIMRRLQREVSWDGVSAAGRAVFDI